MIELFHSLHSTCSQKVRLCLAEKGLAWTGHHLNLRRFDQLEPAFLAMNPAGMVPVLRDGDWTLNESRVINEYLEEAYPEVRLTPRDARERARMRLWTKYSDDVATDAVKLPSFVKNIQPELQKLTPAEVNERVAKIPDPKVRARWIALGVEPAPMTPPEKKTEPEAKVEPKKEPTPEPKKKALFVRRRPPRLPPPCSATRITLSSVRRSCSSKVDWVMSLPRTV